MSRQAEIQTQQTPPLSQSGILQRAIAGNKGVIWQRHASNQAEPTEAPLIVHEVLNSPGQPLEAETRTFMESRFGHDFSSVRVHTSEKAAESAQAVNAQAYTVRQDMVFGAGQYAPKTSSGRQLLAHELTHVVQQSRGGGSPGLAMRDSLESEADQCAANFLSKPVRVTGSSEIGIAKQAGLTQDISKLDVAALLVKASSLSSWFEDHLVDEPDYSEKLQESVDVFVEISARRGTQASSADIEALKARLVARSPRTAFEHRVRRGELPAYKPVYDKGEVVGYSYSSGGYSKVVDLDGNTVWSHEIPIETPLLDPIDLIPFELLGSLTVKAVTIGLRATAKVAVKVLAKDASKVIVEEGVKLGTKEVAAEASKVGIKKLEGAAAQKATKTVVAEGAGKTATGDAAKAVTGDLSKSGLDALVQIFRKGEKFKSVGGVSLNRLRQVLGRAGVSPKGYKLVKVSKQVSQAMEKETGETIWGWVSRTGEGQVAKDAKGRPIINFTTRALASLEEAVKTFGHEAKHLKDFAAGLTESSEALAEIAGEKLWVIVQESLRK